ncbi:hypothetical protein BB561_000036 [Smittium simulii]|uniref:Uncharacterized protein n=1 Tax=Smittium simulii TaxID=133385 RepID=A0A2T9Z109_9FUNG|nr:hypothetical protein BB561_000036 [Smittium simulii]
MSAWRHKIKTKRVRLEILLSVDFLSLANNRLKLETTATYLPSYIINELWLYTNLDLLSISPYEFRTDAYGIIERFSQEFSITNIKIIFTFYYSLYHSLEESCNVGLGVEKEMNHPD